MKLGNAIKMARKNRKLTQTDLGNLVGVSPQSISYYEKGKKTGNLFNLKKICDALDISLDKILS